MADNGDHTVVVVDADAAAAEVVHFDPARIRMSPQAMRMLTLVTGRTMEQLMGSDEPADKFQTMTFFELHRRHPHVDPARLWEMAGVAEIELGGDMIADPFATASATAEPLSPATGDSTPTPSTT